MGACLKNQYGNSCDCRVYHFNYPSKTDSKITASKVSDAGPRMNSYGRKTLSTMTPEQNN
jgi:hypothetical protein